MNYKVSLITLTYCFTFSFLLLFKKTKSYTKCSLSKKKHYVKNVDQILFLQPLRVEEHKRKNVNNEPTTWCHTFRIKIKKQNIIFSRLTSFFFLIHIGSNFLPAQIFLYFVTTQFRGCANVQEVLRVIMIFTLHLVRIFL